MSPDKDLTTSISSIHIPSRMKMIGCKESFVEFYIDPQVAQQNVPSGYEVRKYPHEKAVLLIMIQEWDRLILDGFLPISHVKMSHIWIELNGPSEIGPSLPDTESSLPTSYYYAMPHQIDNLLAFLAFKLVGIDVQLVKQIAVKGVPGVLQWVRVVERENPTISYSWEASGSLWDVPKIVTGRRWFYRNYGRRLNRKSVGLVVCRSRFFGESAVQMSIDAGSILGGMGFGSELQGTLQYVTTDCSCTIHVGIG